MVVADQGTRRIGEATREDQGTRRIGEATRAAAASATPMVLGAS